MNIDFERRFEYENNFYATASLGRISKFATHMDLFRKISGLAGDIVECGVFKGNSLMRWINFRSLFENAFSRKIIAFDTFGAFPETDHDIDRPRRDEFIKETMGGQSISKDQLVAGLQKLQLYQNIDLIEGNILKTVPEFLGTYDYMKIALLHIDVDIYEPTKVALERFYPHVVRGGIIILDDYGAMPGANKAIDDFFQGTSMKIQKLPYSNAISFIEKP